MASTDLDIQWIKMSVDTPPLGPIHCMALRKWKPVWRWDDKCGPGFGVVIMAVEGCTKSYMQRLWKRLESQGCEWGAIGVLTSVFLAH
jgi:hypothetical protein